MSHANAALTPRARLRLAQLIVDVAGPAPQPPRCSWWHRELPTSGPTACNEAAEGHRFADDVQKSGDPMGRGTELVNFVTSTTPTNSSQAEWEVESAIYLDTPATTPKIKDEAGAQPAPAT